MNVNALLNGNLNNQALRYPGQGQAKRKQQKKQTSSVKVLKPAKVYLPDKTPFVTQNEFFFYKRRFIPKLSSHKR